MFATLAGRYPSPGRTVSRDNLAAGPAASGDAPAAVDTPSSQALEAVVRAQEAAGIELVSDGGLQAPRFEHALAVGLGGRIAADGRVEFDQLPDWRGPLTVEAWRATAALTDRVVKATVVGPYTLGRSVGGTLGTASLTVALAEALHEEIRALVEAGCPYVEVAEDAACAIGDDEGERHLFRDSQRMLIEDFKNVHLSLVVRGGSADSAGADTILDAPYASYLFDLTRGPDNWRLIRAVPADRGVVCGALDTRPDSGDDIESLVWAAHYAASIRGRGLDRVGLAPAGDLDALSWAEAGRKLSLLGHAVVLATRGPDEVAAAIDPRAVDIRSAALGRFEPRR